MWSYSVLLVFFYISETIAVTNEVRCGTVDIRNSPRMAFQPRSVYKNDTLHYRDCTIIDGDLSITMITQGGHSDEDYPVFENLREITGSVLIFQANKLKSLSRLLPNLRVIGGYSLIMNYALVVYQNPDLKVLNLTNLVMIKNGGVRITENSMLCYTKHIIWDKILVGSVRDYIIDEVAGRCERACSVENESLCELDDVGKPICWNPTTYQKACKTHIYMVESSGCTDLGEPCHPLCVGGCFETNNPGACYSCRKYDVEGVCVEECPPGMYLMLKRRCLTREVCLELQPIITRETNFEIRKPWKAFQGVCHYDCPNGYEIDPDDMSNCIRCIEYCPKVCYTDVVDSMGTALKLVNCNIIGGNLEVDMRLDMETMNPEQFTEAFGDIMEVRGYFMIRFSTSFMSLYMFKNLKVVHGQTLWKNMYGFVVFENPNVRQLFRHGGIELVRGKVIIQNNRMLCYKMITNFLDNSIIHENISDSDVSAFSNGDKAICDEVPFEILISSVYAFGFTVSWTNFNTTDMDHRKFLGYQIFYKQVEKEDENMSVDDNRSACSDSWTMVFVTEGSMMDETGRTKIELGGVQRGELVHGGIEPNTIYAVYVQTRLVNHPGAKNAISKIHFVHTAYSTPDPPRSIKSHALDANTIKIYWETSMRPRGVITHYSVTWLFEPPFRHPNATLLCTMRSRSTNHILQVQSNGMTLKESFRTSPPGTCSAEFGCCKCDAFASPESQLMASGDALTSEKARFENHIQNLAFVQKDNFTVGRRYRRALSATSDVDDKRAAELLSDNNRTLFEQESAPEEVENKDNTAYEDIHLMDPYSEVVEQRLEQLRREHPQSTVLHIGRLDEFIRNATVTGNGTEMRNLSVTTMSIVLTGLQHYSAYQVGVGACQNVSVSTHYCSSRASWTFMRTLPIMEYDHVASESVVLMNVTDDRLTDRKIYWEAPKRPNGLVLTYRVKLYRDDESTPIEQCIAAAVFERSKGILFSGLSAGLYNLEIRVESSTEVLGNVTVVKHLFEIPSPTIFTLRNILIMAGMLLLILIISTTLCFRYAAHQVEGKMGEVTQNITNNPDYLSHYNYYSEDDWELNRDDIDLKEKIGSGTFGSVFLGEGKNVLSLCGERFGKCAVKTIPEETNSQDRFLFLCEANVMKQFNTEFIVKLYGVVSNGSPVLIVMEMMEKGNLRDYLRSVRPGGPDNKDNLPPPTLEDYFTWAAQIADGMAYLETKQFCHRDLAARNCMVHANRMVKIGDFGMTRDLYYQEYYRPAGKRMMPVRWMSPEALKDGTFNLRSDIWSYGIVLFEMLTLGEQPYGGMGNDEVFHMIVVQRHVPRKPIDCHPFWYSIMRACWQRDPRRRPYFHQIVRHLQQNASSEFKRLSYVLNELKVSKETYNFSDLCEDQGGIEHTRHNDVDYREKQSYMSSIQAHDVCNDELAKEKQLGVYVTGAANGNNNDELNYRSDNRDSLASLAIKKAREFGVPFIGRPHQNRLNNYKADKFTVFATLLGFNPRMSRKRKRGGAEKCEMGADQLARKENPQSAAARGNDYTRQTISKKEICLEIGKEEEKRLKPDDENSHEEDDDEHFDDEDDIYDEEANDEEMEDGSELDESDVNDDPLQKVSSHTPFQSEVRRLLPKATTAHQPQYDYVDADLALRGYDLTTANRTSKRRSASMTSSSSSLHTVPTKPNAAVQKQ